MCLIWSNEWSFIRKPGAIKIYNIVIVRALLNLTFDSPPSHSLSLYPSAHLQPLHLCFLNDYTLSLKLFMQALGYLVNEQLILW